MYGTWHKQSIDKVLTNLLMDIIGEFYGEKRVLS